MVNVESLESGKVSLFAVFNTAHKSLLILARDRNMALNIAWAEGHIRHTDSGLMSEGRDAHEVKPAAYPAIKLQLEAGITQRLQGVVTVDSGKVFVGRIQVIV